VTEAVKLRLREAEEGDEDFLFEMLLAAVNWRPGSALSRVEITATPELHRYVAGWPRARDLGVVAEHSSRPVGAAWLRFFPRANRGYGFVAADIPELSIGVVDGHRGEGVGRQLLRELHFRARRAGIERISLSVDRENRARRLYLDEGYRTVGRFGTADTMLVDLTAPR
jgi:GNAT superfamily N-acetyltransferase